MPRERFNVFSGNNGQGKTNLLEAIFVVASLRSFRTSKLSDLVAFGARSAKLGVGVPRGNDEASARNRHSGSCTPEVA
jgi:DNA replication and repair protein RecF